MVRGLQRVTFHAVVSVSPRVSVEEIKADLRSLVLHQNQLLQN